MNYTLSRSKRKTVAIYVRNGMVEVRAPLRMAKRDIDKFVASKEARITDILARSSDQAARRERFKLDYGSLVTYRGKQYPIMPRDGESVGFDECFYMPPGLSPNQIKIACVKIYRMLAHRDLTERTLDFAERLGVIPAAVKITGAKTRWGSCSTRKNINFSWRLIMADDAVIDYVVLHEVAHLRELNHSKKFWSIVADAMPDYKGRQKRLRDLHRQLVGEDWD